MFTDESKIVNDVTRNHLHFIQISTKRLKKDTGTQVNNSTFIFIADKVFGFPVVFIRSLGLLQKVQRLV